MPLFISYAHQDQQFVEKLAMQLVLHKAWVWVDKWEIKVGESILEKVQSAIQEASALLVVLSRASVRSQWCRKELNAGLMRELSEKHVLVLPVIKENCVIPVFLREKRYADFRESYDEGFKAVMEAVAEISSVTQGRLRNPNDLPFHTDWSCELGTVGDSFVQRVNIVDHGGDCPYCILTEITLVANRAGSDRYLALHAQGDDALARREVLELLATFVASRKDCFTILEDANAVQKTFEIDDRMSGTSYLVTVSSRRMGIDTGLDTIVHWDKQIQSLLRSIRARSKEGANGMVDGRHAGQAKRKRRSKKAR